MQPRGAQRAQVIIHVPADMVVRPGQRLRVGARVTSKNGRYALTLQADGDLVLVAAEHGGAVWRSGTAGQRAAYATMQHDGDFVVADESGRVLWATRTAGNTGAWLAVQDDGALAIYAMEPIFETAHHHDSDWEPIMSFGVTEG